MNFLQRLWAARAAPTPAPPAANQSVVDITAIFAPTPAPALKQEQFADNHAQARQQAERQHTLYRQVVAHNNRHVTRDLGSHVVDETRALKYDLRSSKPMTEIEWTEVEAHGILRIEVGVKK